MPRIAKRFSDDAVCSKGFHKILPGPAAPFTTVFVENFPVAVMGDMIMPHWKKKHAVSVILEGWPTVFVNNMPVATMYMPTLCGGMVITTTFGVFAGPIG